MAPHDRKRFSTCLLAASEIHGKAVSDAVVKLWWEALKRFDIEAVEAAFQRHITSPDNGQFMPKPADMIRILEGTSEDGAQIAWAKVDKAVRQVGPYPSVTFDDPLIQRVLQDMGGWVELCRKDNEAWPFVANEFRTRYHAYRQGSAPSDYPPLLAGIAQTENASRGVAAQAEHVLIGDRELALRVAHQGTDRPAIGFTRVDERVFALPSRRTPMRELLTSEATDV